MSPKPDGRERLESLLDDAVEAQPGTRNTTTRERMAFDIRHTRFTQAQEDLLREAERRRGMSQPTGAAPSYIAMATLAFVAFDLGMDVFEVLSGLPFPDEGPLRDHLLRLAREQRGQWGIVALDDRTEGR